MDKFITFCENGIKHKKKSFISPSMQTAPSVPKALEQFVKPEQLDGENAYKCTKWVSLHI